MCPSSTTSSDSAAGPAAPPRALRDDELVPLADFAALGLGRKVLCVVAVVVAAAAFVGTTAWDRLAPVEPPKLIGPEKLEEERKDREASPWDASLMRRAETKLQRTSRARYWATPYWTGALYEAFGSAGPNALLGADGWMFNRARVCAGRDAAALAPPAAALAAAAARRLEALGVETVLAVIPRKEAVYHESLPRGVDASPAFEPRFHEELVARGARAPDLWSAFRAAASRPTYRRKDTHWNDEGADVAAEGVARTLRGGVASRPTTTLRRSVKFSGTGDLLRTSGLVRTDRTNPLEWGEDEPRVDVVTAKGPTLPRDKGPADPAPAVLVGTSFSTGSATNFVHLLAHYLGEPVFSAAKPAGGPVQPLRAYFDRVAAGEAPKPRMLIWEIPAHYAFAGQPLDGLAEFFAERAPERLVALERVGDGGPLLVAGARPGRVARGKWFSAATRRGALAFAGNGELSFRLRGRVTAGEARVVVEAGDRSTSYRWPAGRTTLSLPIVVAEGGDEARLGVQASGGDVELEEIALETDLDLPRGVAAVVAPAAASAGGVAQDARPAQPVPATPYAHAVFTMVAEPPSGPMAFEAFDAEGRDLGRRTLPAVVGGGVVLVPLRPDRGSVASLRVRAASGAPRPLIATAAVVPPVFGVAAPR